MSWTWQAGCGALALSYEAAFREWNALAHLFAYSSTWRGSRYHSTPAHLIFSMIGGIVAGRAFA